MLGYLSFWTRSVSLFVLIEQTIDDIIYFFYPNPQFS